MLYIRKNSPYSILFYIVDTITNLPKTGLTYSDIIVKYKKYATSFFADKSLDNTNFREIGYGIYEIDFTSDELDAVGSMIIIVSGNNIYCPPKEVYIVDTIKGEITFGDSLR